MHQSFPQCLSDGLHFEDGGTLYFSELERVVAFLQPSFIGEDLSLALDFGCGRVVQLTEADDAWAATVTALDLNPQISTSSHVWSLELASSQDRNQTVELLNVTSKESWR
jgi:hypothetical protein